MGIREDSGSVDIDSKLVSFLCELMRDHVPPGVTSDCQYSNGWLAKYAEYCATRISSQ